MKNPSGPRKKRNPVARVMLSLQKQVQRHTPSKRKTLREERRLGKAKID